MASFALALQTNQQVVMHYLLFNPNMLNDWRVKRRVLNINVQVTRFDFMT